MLHFKHCSIKSKNYANIIDCNWRIILFKLETKFMIKIIIIKKVYSIFIECWKQQRHLWKILWKSCCITSKPEIQLSQFPAHVYHFYLTRVAYFKVQKPFQKDSLICTTIKTKSCFEPGLRCNIAFLRLRSFCEAQPSMFHFILLL